MVRVISGIVCVLAMCVVIVGCNKPTTPKKDPAKPGATDTAKGVGIKADPTTEIEMKQGEEKTVKLTFERKDAHKDKEIEVTSSDVAAKKLTVTAEKVAKDKNETTVKIKAADDAPEGEVTVTVTAKSADTTSTHDIKVKVKKK